METFIITAAASNSGKTTLSLGLARALRNRGLNISVFKAGPDYIDLDLLERASGKRGGNIDFHLMGEEGVRQSLALNLGDYGLIEGAMGYFDGIHNGYENSSFDISKKLDIPAILVYRPQGQMFTVIPKIKGMVDFSQGRIKGLILNAVSARLYELLKPQIEKHIDIQVLGYLPHNSDLKLESVNLGLDIEEADESFLNLAADFVEKTIDIDKLLKLTRGINLEKPQPRRKRKIRLALAKDQAFNFYYKEDIALLEEVTELVYFSPLKDSELPKADFIYIGGGYPEKHLKELADNYSMKESIKEAVEEGTYLLAQAGGLTYLMEGFEGFPMVGIFKGQVLMSKSLQNFGYNQLELLGDCILGKKGWTIKAREYHRSYIEGGAPIKFEVSKTGESTRKWSCGYSYKNAIGSFSQFSLLGNINSFDYLLDSLEREASHVY